MKTEVICMDREERKAVLAKLESEGVVWIGGNKATDDILTKDLPIILSIGDWELRGDKRIAWKFYSEPYKKVWNVKLYKANEYLRDNQHFKDY